MQPSILITACISLACWQAGAQAQTAVPTSTSSTPFDGIWSVTQICPDSGSARGYTIDYTVDVRNGVLNGQRGTKGKTDSTSYTGQIASDGTAKIRVEGLTGSPAYTPGGLPAGTPFGYTISGTFSGGTGKAIRTETRPCTFEFSREQVFRWSAAVDLEQGAYRNCGDPPFIGRKVVLTGNAFVAEPDRIDRYNTTTRLNLKSLASDGSGRITATNPENGRKYYFDFDAGKGPRIIRVRRDSLECVYRWKPF